MDANALAVVAVGFSVFALTVVVAVAVRVGRLLRAYDGLVAGGRGIGARGTLQQGSVQQGSVQQGSGEQGESFATAVARQNATVVALRQDVLALRADLAATATDLSGAVRRVSVVRYDAFGDMGGLLSFSVALLDDAGDGLVLTSINGRSETRTYAKGVQGGTGQHALSPEEIEAVATAIGARLPR